MYSTVDLKMYKLDPNEDDPGGVAARQLLVRLVPLHHRHLAVDMKIRNIYNIFKRVSEKNINSYFVGVEADKPFYVLT